MLYSFPFPFLTALTAVCLLFPSTALAGIYSGPTDTFNLIDGAIASGDVRFVEWADAIDPDRTAFAPRGATVINQSGGFNSLGDLDATQIAAGVSPGYLTVSFPTGIRNGSGADFAVFENGFRFGTNGDGVSGLFAEFAYVDVSSNGTDFARFPSIYLNGGPLAGGFGTSFVGFDVTNVYNLAGKHAAGYGTPFDLDDLSTDPLVAAGLLDLNNIQFVRMFDIPGNGAFTDSLGNPIRDNWVTSGSGGFDFRLGPGLGVGVLNVASVPEPGSFAILALSIGLIAFKRNRKRLSVGRAG
ncbi:hypothetical protein FF011L_32870 [Roseimaritima multifibrata]|uniref:Ice-binding protein C-terminal domain-containing protein n=1 Tax=Roseimaritima multifibrata TaxID=1930274 RepID=A0A517MHZ8_9BACT|nr:PEP-CTERM sorting domain-containing protein [Roseimaritima multifibrata]QDS94508.1 hypothetical protein FF011L_32870 [Roseimaritima multifibrata]